MTDYNDYDKAKLAEAQRYEQETLEKAAMERAEYLSVGNRAHRRKLKALSRK
jgi:hypothetical protein